QSKQKVLYHELRMQRQATRHGLDKQGVLEEQMQLLRSADHNNVADSQNSVKAVNTLMKKVNEHLSSELSQSLALWTCKIEEVKKKLHLTNSKLKTSQNEAACLWKTCIHSRAVQECAVMTAHQKVLKEKSVHRLMNKGVFTDETCNVVHLLVKAGCSINRVLHGVLSAAGIKTIGTISRPTITHIMQEGYYAAQIQLGYELKNAASMTFSADGTSHRSINYNSRHVNLKAEVYGADVPEKEQVTHFFGIKSSCDGSSEESINDWQ
ncbi:hypothetical protein BYT27DRAFT_7035001, partial [Phlegmacium glaucopus]